MEVILFEKNIELFENNANLGIEINSNQAVIINNRLNKISLPIILGEGELTVSGDTEKLKFKDIPKVSIEAKAGLKIAIYDTAEEAVKDLLINDTLNVELPELDNGFAYGVFSFNYTISGKAEGKWPLGSVSTTASVSASKKKRAAVIVKLAKTERIRSAIGQLISELQSPSRVKRANDLSPGTFLVMEREGALNAKLGAQAGFDFDWEKESQNPNFSGTVSLQAKLAAEISIGLNLQNNFSLVVSRPEEVPTIRVQLYKRKLNGWNFAAGLNAWGKADLGEFNELSVEDLIKATIGIHHGQILEDIRKYSNPDNLKDELFGITEDIVKKITQIDIIKDAKKTLNDLFEKWDAVGAEGGEAIFKLIKDNTSVDLQSLQTELKDLGNPDTGVSKFLEEKMQDTGFHDTALGQVLESIVPFDDLFDLVGDQELVKKLQEKALKTSELLDFEALIKNLHKEISEKLSIGKIKKAAKFADEKELSDWLKGKLESLFDGQKELIDELKAINTFIENMHKKGEKILEKVKTALQKEYELSLAFTYQKEKEHSALIDASFSFNADTNPTNGLQALLKGDYGNLLTNEIKGIHLSKGVLTHRVKKQKTFSLSIPGVKRDFTRINESFVKGTFMSEVDGRFIMYEFESSDTIKKNREFIKLAIMGDYLGKKKQNDFGVEKESLKVSFDFKYQEKALSKKLLTRIIDPFIEINLKEPFSEITDLTKTNWVKQLKSNHRRKKVLGNTLIRMTVKMSSDLGRAWYSAPTKKKDDKYKKLSGALQSKLRELLFITAFENEVLLTKGYALEKLQAVILYASLPVMYGYDYDYYDLIKDFNSLKTNLAKTITTLHNKLENSTDPELKKRAKRFRNINNSIQEIIERIETSEDFEFYLNLLVGKEEMLIEKVINSAIKIGEAKENAASDPKRTMRRLSSFGKDLTKALNSFNINFITKGSGGDFTRFFGANLFITASKVFDPNIDENTTGYLELIVLNKDSKFKMKSFMYGEKPPSEDRFMSQLIVDLE
ncbi:hypothetical protein [Jejuia spongiicola]|uniref:Uncharacterized protein n=1 Tax=Jejuia spongiicola TaxID=2942207 RepID=A0ABT0QD13_9FLAO|nr:hypothetical protein [Jejuia spongiicola]MCL6294867.1 hypothetical protein [Jejuia spongiicola]